MNVLIGLIVVLIVVGLLLYVVTLLPFDAKIKQIIQVLVILLAVLWILGSFMGYAPAWR